MNHSIRWTSRKIAQRLSLITPLIYRRRKVLPPFRYLALDGPLDPPPIERGVDTTGWQIIEPSAHWGTWMTDFVLRTEFAVPTDWDFASPVALYLPLGESGKFDLPEALAYIDGIPFSGIDRQHQEIALLDRWRDGAEHLLALHGWTGIAPGDGKRLYVSPCYIVQIDQACRNFVAMARIALSVVHTLDINNPLRGQLLSALDEAFHVLDTCEPLNGSEAFYASVTPAHHVLRARIERTGVPVNVDIIATGQAHIDLAWLWPLPETRRRVERTFHTVIRLMDQFPEYHFTQSQPQLYEFIRQEHPPLFEAIRQRVDEGRWELTGDMWVEADCILSSGESLARHFLFGRRYFRDHFGHDAASQVLWLPDVFGYSWTLPQMMKEAEIKYLFATKIDWNQYDSFPFNSFWWQGLDGTRVLAHLSPSALPGEQQPTFNSLATPEYVSGAWVNYKQKDTTKDGMFPPIMMPFGNRGGGGPNQEMLENLREMTAFPGLPRVRQGQVQAFYDELAKFGDCLPTWNSELYLEYHRGTYTSQANTKRNNRKSEFLLHDTEFIATLASLIDRSYPYPRDVLNHAWHLVCLNQFHDILPGSSIGKVYIESQAQYEDVQRLCQETRDSAFAVIARYTGGDLLVTNPTSFERDDPVFWSGSLQTGQSLQRLDRTNVPIQRTDDGIWIGGGPWPAYSVTPLMVEEGNRESLSSDISATSTTLENQYLHVEFDNYGDIVRIYDKDIRREIVVQGTVANQFQAFEDRPLAYDAWNIDIYYDEKMWTAEPATSMKVVECGPLRAVLEVRRRILHSDFVQRISLSRNSRRLCFDTIIDWREQHILLKVAFPVAILSPTATYEIQWGNIQRPTHRNTSWDWARFETYAHKWVDLSEGDYGVSLLNDCKYGHDIHDNVMRLSLLRSPTYPDPEADLGEHRFTYCLLPHPGDWSESIGEAYALNDPLIAWTIENELQSRDQESSVGASGSLPSIYTAKPLISVDQPSIVIETIKGAEDGNGIIVRLYESQRKRGEVTLTTAFALAAACRTNLLEDDKERLEVHNNHVKLDILPYQIVSLRLVPVEG